MVYRRYKTENPHELNTKSQQSFDARRRARAAANMGRLRDTWSLLLLKHTDIHKLMLLFRKGEEIKSTTEPSDTRIYSSWFLKWAYQSNGHIKQQTPLNNLNWLTFKHMRSFMNEISLFVLQRTQESMWLNGSLPTIINTGLTLFRGLAV